MSDEIKKMLGEILTTVKSLERRIDKLETGDAGRSVSASAEPAAPKPVSIKEFLISKSPSNGVMMTLAVGFYLENFDGVSPFTAADLESGFRAARETLPPNINDKANNCVKNGLFMEAREKKGNLKAWLVTRTGEELVRAGFDKGRS